MNEFEKSLFYLSMLGLNHKSAPLKVRELFYFTPQKLQEISTRMKETGVAKGAVGLSTCNRTEFYWVSSASCWEGCRHLQQSILANSGIDIAQFKPYTYCKTLRGCVEHLFGVASGVDSLVVGEAQILGQVKDAFDAAREAGSLDFTLDRLLTWAIRTAKRVRTETRLGEGNISVPSVALDLAERIFGDLSQLKIVLVGAGETAELAAKYFVDHKPKDMSIINRTYSKAEQLAERYGGQAFLLDDLCEKLREADIAIFAISTDEAIVDKSRMEKIMHERAYRLIVLLDLGVPRNVNPLVNDIDNIFLYDIDSLQRIVQDNMVRRQVEISKAQDIILVETEKFVQWWGSLELNQVIKRLRLHFENLRQEELKRSARNTSPEELKRLEVFSTALLNKLLHNPTLKLKELENDSRQSEQIVQILESLFNLNGSSSNEDEDQK